MKIQISDKNGKVITTITISDELSVHIANENGFADVTLKESENHEAEINVKNDEETPTKEILPAGENFANNETRKETEKENEKTSDIANILTTTNIEKGENNNMPNDEKSVIKDIIEVDNKDVIVNEQKDTEATAKETLKKILEIGNG